ncbi:MAG TPA: BrnT family toxin [Rhodospirillales bacterium]|nr:BrnT family toxin [Rhodospirillales bacterium]
MFEWDEEKRLENIEKHGVDFIRAAMIFEGPIIEDIDGRKDYGELRFRAIGHMENEFYVVIYTWRDETRRIISAWKAGENGKRKYQAAVAGRAENP